MCWMFVFVFVLYYCFGGFVVFDVGGWFFWCIVVGG